MNNIKALKIKIGCSIVTPTRVAFVVFTRTHLYSNWSLFLDIVRALLSLVTQVSVTHESVRARNTLKVQDRKMRNENPTVTSRQQTKDGLIDSAPATVYEYVFKRLKT